MLQNNIMEKNIKFLVINSQKQDTYCININENTIYIYRLDLFNS